MNQIFFTDERIVILSDSAKEAHAVYEQFLDDERLIHTIYPPISTTSLEILLEAILSPTSEPDSDTAALLSIVEALENLLEILSNAGDDSGQP